MNHQENTDAEGRSPLTSEKELEEAIQSTEKQEQLYSIALFDILGFSNFVECNGTHVIMELYQKLLDLIHPLESQFCRPTPHVGSVVPVPMSPDWKYSQLVADGNGYVRTCHFSDTFIIYVSYLFQKEPWLLRDTLCEPHPLLLGPQTEAARLFYGGHHIYLSFLQICMEFFCQAVKAGIPLRGCISTGLATMDKHRSIYFGRPLVEAARGEPAQNGLGIAFGRSFQHYHPVYSRYFIPYLGHIKANNPKAEFLSPIMVDWPRFWRGHPEFRNLSAPSCIQKMNQNAAFSSYYENAIAFSAFSQQHENWTEKITWEGIASMEDFFRQARAWHESVQGEPR